MSRREPRGAVRPHLAMPPPPPSKCAKFLYYTWKLCSVLFSHLVMISLVVAYCILGAVTFERLEADHEREVKRNISQIRSNTTHSIWSMTRAAPLLNQTHWTGEVALMLKDFESSILLEMKVRGWDGNESPDHIQWTFTGALFYSIIVITTIGYGHIAPKTQTGKVVTIFYAILGIPLMLLCLSNIGDVMASSFRFLYWRVCCYVCTRPPRRPRRSRRPHHTHGARRSTRARTRTGSSRRRKPVERAHSDTDFRYRDSGYSSGRARRPATRPAPRPRPQSQPPPLTGRGREFDPGDRSPAMFDPIERDHYDEENESFPKISLPLQDLAAALKDLDEHQTRYSKMDLRSKSLPRPAKLQPDYGRRREWDSQRDYELGDRDKDMYEMHDLHDVDYENFKERKALEEREMRRNGRYDDDYDVYRERDQGYDPEDDDFEFDDPRNQRTWDDRRRYRGRSEYYEPRQRAEYGERRARSVTGGREPRRLRRLRTVDETRPGHHARYTPSPVFDEWSEEETVSPRRNRTTGWDSRQLDTYSVPLEPTAKEMKPVPIWLCVFLVASYIVAGTFLFKRWEGWAYLDAAYFCFITLTTIGFGDFVPAQGGAGGAVTASAAGAGAGAGGGEGGEAAAGAVHSIALCSLYLLFGIALLAMSFNLVQEEVRANVAALATRLGIIKPPRSEPDLSDTDY